MVVYCCVPGCGVTTKSGLKMHVLPKDLERRKQWCKHINRPDLIDLDERRRLDIIRVCESHFRDSDKFDTSDNKTNLRFTALPWIIPESSRGPEDCGSSDVDMSQPGPSKLAEKKDPTTSEPLIIMLNMSWSSNTRRKSTGNPPTDWVLKM